MIPLDYVQALVNIAIIPHAYKPALLNNGLKTTVPPYIAVGTKIVVLTEDGSYMERAKD